MNNTYSLNPEEAVVVFGLLGLILWEAIQAYRSRCWVSVYRPTLVVAIILSWYVLLSPLQQVFSTGAAISRGLNHRDLLISGWTGAFLFYGSLLVGFHGFTKSKIPRRLILEPVAERIHLLGVRLCQVGLLMFFLVTGQRLVALFNPLGFSSALVEAASSGFNLGPLNNYFNYAVNFLIPGICLMAVAWFKTRRHTATISLWSFAALGIYTTLGFRYRLVLLIIPALLLWFMSRRRRPPLVLVSIFLAVFISIQSVIGFTRSYGQGLDLGRLDGKSIAELAGDGGLGEQGVFLATAGVISQAPDRSPFVGLAPFVNTILFPIPREIFPGKPAGEYGAEAIRNLYGDIYMPGAAFMNYAEYYLIAGWPSLIAMSMAFGWLLRRLWNWFLWRQDEPFAQVIYLLTATYLYMVISRGYLPQVVMLFIFTVAPLWWLYGRWAQPVSRLEDPSSLPRG